MEVATPPVSTENASDTIGYAALVVDVSEVRLRAQGNGAQHYNKEQKQSETPRCMSGGMFSYGSREGR